MLEPVRSCEPVDKPKSFLASLPPFKFDINTDLPKTEFKFNGKFNIGKNDYS
jgi:hypothetical protein